MTAAREEAKRLKRAVDAGNDPLGKRIDHRNAPTMSDLINRYLREHAIQLAPRSFSDRTSLLHKLVEPEWGTRKVADITPEDGQGMLTGNLFGVAATTVAEGESVKIATVGVYELPKLASAVVAGGSRVSWDNAAKQVVLPATGMVPIGIATVGAGNGVATVRVRLDGVATAPD